MLNCTSERLATTILTGRLPVIVKTHSEDNIVDFELSGERIYARVCVSVCREVCNFRGIIVLQLEVCRYGWFSV